MSTYFVLLLLLLLFLLMTGVWYFLPLREFFELCSVFTLVLAVVGIVLIFYMLIRDRKKLFGCIDQKVKRY